MSLHGPLDVFLLSAPLFLGATYSLGEARLEGVGPPVAPPNLIWLVLLVNLPVFLLTSPVNLLLFWDWIACELITLFAIFFHAVILPDYRFFFEVPSFEELQDSDSSPRREEVGRRTLGDCGGFLPSFLYRDRFRSFLENPLSTFTK